LGGLLILALLTFYITIKSWREAKRSPYFFQRIQAARKMQRYMLAFLLLVLAVVVTTGYAWQAPKEVALPIARLSHAKPSQPLNVDTAVAEPDAQGSPVAVEINLSTASERNFVVSPDFTDPLLNPALPAEFDKIDTAVEVSEATEIGTISFSTDINNNYQAVNPLRRFSEGFFTLYATFDYLEMADDMTWSWVWRHNGEVVDGGNQPWSYGQDGPGYVYFQPEEGFQPGEYSLEVWVNDDLMAQSSLMVTDTISANN
jgi:hypothetical protein